MADNNVAVQNEQPVVNQQQQQNNPHTSPWEIMKSLASRMLMMYVVVTAMNYFRQKPAAINTNSSDSAISEISGNMFQKGTRFVRLSQNCLLRLI